MPRNGASAFDVTLWADSLGLLPIPAFSGDDRPRFVMLNGPTGNFFLDLTQESIDQRAVAWSTDVGHYVSVLKSTIEVQRWDTFTSAPERYPTESVLGKLLEFHNYLDRSQPRYERSVVPHAIRIFRMLRSSLQLEQGEPALLAFLAMLATVTDDCRRGQLDLARWRLPAGTEAAVSRISEHDWDLLSRELVYPDVATTPAEAAAEVEDSFETTFGLERDLQNTLRKNISQLEDGLKIVDGGKERSVTFGRIDILAVASDGTHVVIELKAGEADHYAIAQILTYMGDLHEEARGKVRGILVAGDFTTRAISASKAVSNVELKRYGVTFSFQGVR